MTEIQRDLARVHRDIMSLYGGRLAAGELPLRDRPPAREVRDASANALLLSLADIVLGRDDTCVEVPK